MLTFDSEGPNSRNNIKRAAKNTVVFSWGVIFPDGCRIFDNRNLGDTFHNVNIPKIYYMGEATKKGSDQ